MSALSGFVWSARYDRETLAAFELFPVPLRTGGQGARTWCRTDGVHQVQVPWARPGSGFTLMMEALIMLLSAEMPVDAVADLVDEHERCGGC